MSDLAVFEPQLPALARELSIDDLTKRVKLIDAVRGELMKEEIHYGVIPGTGKKPTLLKAGAEMLCEAFMLAPYFRTEKRWHEDGHLDVVTYVTLRHIPTNETVLADIEGFCSTRESKYRYRTEKSTLACPECGVEGSLFNNKAPAKTKQCMGSKGGCWAKFEQTDPRLKPQGGGGKIENPDIADTVNTVIKMSQKRALVAAALIATGTSSMFTQDLEDLPPTESGTPKTDTQPGAPPQQPESPVAEAASEPPTEEATQAAPVTDELISEPQRRLLFAKAKEVGIGPADLKLLVGTVTGQESTSGIRSDQFEELLKKLDEATS